MCYLLVSLRNFPTYKDPTNPPKGCNAIMIPTKV